jgi:hypothetical protein
MTESKRVECGSRVGDGNMPYNEVFRLIRLFVKVGNHLEGTQVNAVRWTCNSKDTGNIEWVLFLG